MIDLSPVQVTLMAETSMREKTYQRAALAWLAELRPVLGLEASEEGIALHLRLVGYDSVYWHRLCQLFTRLGMGDR